MRHASASWLLPLMLWLPLAARQACFLSCVVACNSSCTSCDLGGRVAYFIFVQVTWLPQLMLYLLPAARFVSCGVVECSAGVLDEGCDDKACFSRLASAADAAASAGGPSGMPPLALRDATVGRFG